MYEEITFLMNKLTIGILIIIIGVVVLFLRFGTTYSLKNSKQPREKNRLFYYADFWRIWYYIWFLFSDRLLLIVPQRQTCSDSNIVNM